MRITNIYDAVREGTFEDFIKFYDGNVKQINEYTKLNLLETAMLNEIYSEEKVRIVEFLLTNGVDINYLDGEYKRNALHILYSSVTRGSIDYLTKITKKLVEYGINLNQKDKYGAIPLSYLISVNKLKTDELKELYSYLLEKGSNYNCKDNYGKSCIDYANDLIWRIDFIELVEEYMNGK